jgi:hypothetical protein
MSKLPMMLGGFVLLAVCALWLASLPAGVVASPGEDGDKGAGQGPKGECPPSWQLVSSPEISSTLNSVDGLAVISSTDAWAIGDARDHWYGVIEHWDGTHWSVVPPAPVLSTSVNMLAIDATGPDDVWIAGYSYMAEENARPLLEHWDGTNWSVVPVSGTLSSEPYLLRGVEALKPSDAWAVGYMAVTGGFNTFIVHWNGAEWQVVPSPNGGALSNVLYDVFAVSPNDIWAVGRYRLPDGTYQPLAMHWDGAAWTIVPSSSGSNDVHHIRGVEAIAPDDVWL